MNRRGQVTVVSELRLRLVVGGGATLPVPARARYEVSDPYAVHVTFQTGAEESVSWVFARDLLAEGLLRSTGEGDVRVWPGRSGTEAVVFVALSSPEGQALLEAPLAGIAAFLAQTEEAVPSGAEEQYVDVDAALDRLLAS
jgi:hypothetical protein